MNKHTASLPHAPGVYLMRDYSGKILYVGKAKNLFKRVSTYFNRTSSEPKTAALISNIKVIDYIIADSEKAALLLENRLIKKFKPKYNVIWRDDKSYPLIRITKEEIFPRLCIARQAQKKNRLSKYFGPYDNSGDLRKLLRYLRISYNIRPCNYDIGESGKPKKFQGCIYCQLKQCPAPCIDKISRNEYAKNVKNAELFLKGKYSELLNCLKKEMLAASKNLDFERAADCRNNIQGIENMFDKIRFREIHETDIESNIKASRSLSKLKEYLGMKKVPVEIEAIDISNIHGNEAVGSLVRFSKGMPDKKNYRRFKIKTVNGIDDYAMIKEVVERRYSRLIKEQQKLPDLVLIDGGKGHLEAARSIMNKLNLNKLPVISLTKENEEIFGPDSEKPITLSKDNPALHILQYLRDEAHRFAVSYHRQRRKIKIPAQGAVPAGGQGSA